MQNENDVTDNILDQLSPQKLKFSAQRGNEVAQCGLAVLFQTAGNYSSAAIWFRFSSQQGFAQAQFNLGCLLLNGIGVPKNYPEAFKFFSAAAEQGYINSIYNLAFMYEHGLGCKKDRIRSYELYKEAADHGDSDSLYKLSTLLFENEERKRAKLKHRGSGWPVSLNTAKAIELLEIAGKNGHKLSLDLLRKLGIDN